jgi:hypothetical protein
MTLGFPEATPQQCPCPPYSLVHDTFPQCNTMAQTNVSWDTIGPFLVWQFLIPLVRTPQPSHDTSN